KDPEIAQAIDRRGLPTVILAHELAGRVAPRGLELFHHDQGGEQAADLVGEFRVAPDVFAQRRPLAPAVAGDDLLGHPVERVAIPGRVRGHGVDPVGGTGSGTSASPTPHGRGQGSKNSGMVASTSLSRLSARMYRLLAAVFSRPRTRAV